MGDKTIIHPVINSYKSHPWVGLPREGNTLCPESSHDERGCPGARLASWARSGVRVTGPDTGRCQAPWVRRPVLGPSGRHWVSGQEWAARLSRGQPAWPAGATRSTRPAGVQGFFPPSSQQGVSQLAFSATRALRSLCPGLQSNPRLQHRAEARQQTALILAKEIPLLESHRPQIRNKSPDWKQDKNFQGSSEVKPMVFLYKVIIQDDGPEKLDPKYFGELLADLSCKNTNLYHCLLEHLQRIGGSKQDFESTDESEDIESLIPKGLSEFTKQQIRYILQMRGMSDKSLRLVLSTFSNIQEELGHLQNDLTSLENDKIRFEKDLAFKETQIKEYEELLASVRANNRQQQQGLEDSTSKCQALEENNLSLRHTLSDIEYKLKELEYCKHNLEQENKNLRVQLSETCTGPMLQAKVDEIGNHYMEMVKNLRMEKDREICKLRELSKLRQDIYSSHNQPSSGGRTTITTRK
eukprot:bmy_12459T0